MTIQSHFIVITSLKDKKINHYANIYKCRHNKIFNCISHNMYNTLRFSTLFGDLQTHMIVSKERVVWKFVSILNMGSKVYNRKFVIRLIIFYMHNN
jgi:hypothetical protein